MANLLPTKGNLIAAKRSRTLARTGYELMDRKRNILIRELMGMIDTAKELQGQIDAVFTEAYTALQAANIRLGICDRIAEAVDVDDSLTLRYRSVMGVELPRIPGQSPPPRPEYGMGDTCSELDECYLKFYRVKELTRRLAGDPSLSVDEAVYRSEKQTGSRNRAMAFLLESCGLLHDDPEEVLDCYFRACSIRVDCRDLAHIACTFAGRGRRSPSGERLFPARYAHYVNAVLMTCGMYNGSGDFAVKVGLPAKSGVGGGIMAVSPARMGIGIYSPGLDEKGNSLAGIRLLEQLGRRLSLSIF